MTGTHVSDSDGVEPCTVCGTRLGDPDRPRQCLDPTVPEPEPPAGLEWATPIALDDGCAVPFPVDALPAGMAEAVTEVAQAILVDPVVPAVAFLGVLAGLVGAQTTVVISESWRETANLYLAVVAETGTGKTPGTRPAWEALHQVERKEIAAAEEEARAARAIAPAKKAELDRLQRAKGRVTADTEAHLLGLTADVERLREVANRERRLVADDVTPERLAELMAQNGERLILIADEGSVFHHLLGMYSAAPNLDTFLKGWDGNPLRVDRKGGNGREKTVIAMESPRLTVVGFVQPTVIARFGEGRHRHLVERGVLGRVLIAWPPDRTGTRLLADAPRVIYRHVAPWGERVQAAYREGPRTLPMSPEARDAYTAWHDRVERGLPVGRVYGDVRESAVKARSSVTRLAGIFARMNGADLVEAEQVARAIRVGDYFLAHAQAVVESWAVTEVGKAKRLLGRLTPGEFVTVRDLRRRASMTGDAVLAALEVLDMHGYVRPVDHSIGYGTSGRQVRKVSPLVEVNPGWR
jgi:hypothetical protein